MELHAVSSNNMEEMKIEINRQRGVWVAHRVVKQHGENENKNK